ncbi:MAG: hypothetical protein KatS3mg077_3258 [Candidatus Binatia bacterium]|nr:MAG: hypothetical protein KatS3mg077_3258 [Candidatus Binatia bacterium]
MQLLRTHERPELPPGVFAIDSHCHLHDPAFDADREDVWHRAVTAGVRALVEIGASGGLDGCRQACALAERYPGIFPTVGIHPHDAKEVTPEVLAALSEFADHPAVVAVGEIGLDYHYDNSPSEQQQSVFRDCIAIARGKGLPITVHLREAEADLIEILRSERAHEIGGVIHCFSGNWDTAKRLLDLGFFLSFSGIVTFKRADAIREAARRVPSDRLLIETDAPYLAPVPKRGHRNEPAFVLYTAACLAELRHAPVEELVQNATVNTLRAFPRLQTAWASLLEGTTTTA